ncbi:hypothetical protein [Calothrix rhizosoleniae]|uniref:hypothetical protein n=1 Tax=Calothrix rhizosoleniae TaxID=888997 RepID=UPI000B4A376D|nr:hypothetical protein [Calothrix rhizosoleniae]
MPSLIFATQTPRKNMNKASQEVPTSNNFMPQVIVATSGILTIIIIALIVYGNIKFKSLNKKIKFEKFKTKQLEKKIKLALDTIRKMETNPDLIHSREFNLDYLRMRMLEEVFHFAIVNQIKIKLKEQISQVLRASQAQEGVVGIASNSGRKINTTFDIEHETGSPPNVSKRILFRIQVKLMKLPTQTTSATISQIIDCVETYLSPEDEQDTWQPTIQGRIVYIHWDQKAKPTPLLVLEQTNEGVNVTFRTNRKRSDIGSNKKSLFSK